MGSIGNGRSVSVVGIQMPPAGSKTVVEPALPVPKMATAEHDYGGNPSCSLGDGAALGVTNGLLQAAGHSHHIWHRDPAICQLVLFLFPAILGWDVCNYSRLLVASSLLDCAQGREEGPHGSFPAPNMAAVRW